ncbi:MAG: serine/threonine protein kinase [Gammaproteobacteria bacterium]|nr:serine/threonine protein kinase [Gammaproteobacteria bacterium]
MDNRKQRERDDATVVKHNDAVTSANPTNLTKVTNWSLDTGQARALTQFYHSLESSNNSVGFEVARQAANQALAHNKIILNNRFVLDSIIGSGGMGTVYKARDLRKVEANAPNPHIAVKVLNEDFQNHPDALITLQREANKSQILAHPNILSVHDFDRDGAVIYMTMEMLDGIDLERQLKSHAGVGMEREAAFKIIKDYCAALIYAHQNDIIHSDFKPSNIFLTKDGSAKILDFGIARLAASAHQQDNFDAGSLGALTPAYASYEMLNRNPPEQRDDVYAAAVIAYELLAGRHPFDQKTAGQALAEGLKPQRISKLTNRQWQALEAGLKIKRQDRSPTVQKFLQDLTQARSNGLLKVAAVAVVGIAAALSYYLFFVPNRLSEGVDIVIKKGFQCLEKKDYSCGKESASAVLKVDPNNKDANLLLQQTNAAVRKNQEQKLVDTATACIESDNLDCARSNLAALKKEQPESVMGDVIQKNIDLRTAHNTAASCLAEQRYDCALSNSALILEKDPNNTFARDITQRVHAIQADNQLKIEANNKKFAELLASAQTCYGKKDYDCGMQNARQALSVKQGDADAEALYQKSLQAKKQIELGKYNQIMANANSCFGKHDYDCSMQYAKQALAVKPADSSADALYQKAAQIKQQQEEQKYRDNLASAEACFGKKDYDCGMQFTKLALTVKPGDASAETLYQKSSEAKNRLMEAMNKAKITLDEGHACFNKKDYGCAVAKSDSALEIIPDLKDAQQLKQSAQKEIAKNKPSYSSDY